MSEKNITQQLKQENKKLNVNENENENENKFKEILTIIDSNKCGHKNKIGDFKYRH